MLKRLTSKNAHQNYWKFSVVFYPFDIFPLDRRIDEFPNNIHKLGSLSIDDMLGKLHTTRIPEL